MAFTCYDFGRSSIKVRVEKAWFGGGNYIPLKLSPELAIKAAVESDYNWSVATTAKTEGTEWIVLRIRLGPEAFAKAFIHGRVHWNQKMTGLQWWGDLETAYLDASQCIEWESILLEPTGLRFPTLFGD